MALPYRTQDGTGDSPLIYACAGGHTAIVQLLLSTGAVSGPAGSSACDVNAANELGRTPLMVAAAGGHLEILRRLLAAGAQVNARDAEGKSAVAHAARAKATEAVQLLRRHGGAGGGGMCCLQ